MPKGVALPSIQQALPSRTDRTERLLASPPAPTRTRRWKWPWAKAAYYQRLSALDRSQILLPDRKEEVALAHLVQEQKPIARRIHRRAADSHRVGMRGASSSSRPIRRNGGRSPLSSSEWEGSRCRTETR